MDDGSALTDVVHDVYGELNQPTVVFEHGTVKTFPLPFTETTQTVDALVGFGTQFHPTGTQLRNVVVKPKCVHILDQEKMTADFGQCKNRGGTDRTQRVQMFFIRG